MSHRETTLDYERNIRVDLENPKLIHAHAIEAHKLGLQHLAMQMRMQEQHYIDANEWSGGGEVMEDFGYFEPVTYCTFNWFAVTLTSYLRLVALVDLVDRNGWSLSDLVANEMEVGKACGDYVSEAAPAVLQWRNKVAAHPAATAPIGVKDIAAAPRIEWAPFCNLSLALCRGQQVTLRSVGFCGKSTVKRQTCFLGPSQGRTSASRPDSGPTHPSRRTAIALAGSRWTSPGHTCTARKEPASGL